MIARALGRRERLKRFIDIFGAVGGLIVLSPVLLGIAVMVRVFLGSPILFRQTRPGMKNQVFVLYKFRTMTNTGKEEAGKTRDEDRLTRFGRVLRSTSLDELPELWNVLLGNMSLVGPRPLLVEYLPLYTRAQSRRHDVRPGITGLAQVSGRNGLEWEERFKLDVWYADHWTIVLDFQIMMKTFLKVLRMEGISGRNTLIMEPFRGTFSSDLEENLPASSNPAHMKGAGENDRG